MTKRMSLSFTLTFIYDHVVQVELSDVVVFLCEYKDRLGRNIQCKYNVYGVTYAQILRHVVKFDS